MRLAHVLSTSPEPADNARLRALLKELQNYSAVARHGPRLDRALDVLNLAEYQIMDLFPAADFATASALLDLVAKAAAPRFAEASTLSCRVLSTGVASFDRVLGGGFHAGQVVEIVGKAGMGKTQLRFCTRARGTPLTVHGRRWCMSMAARQALQGRGVVYIDTEGRFSAERLVHIITALGGTHDMAACVSVLKAEGTSSAQLLALLQGLEQTIIEHEVGLVVCDSVAANIRVEFASDKLRERQQALARQASQLKYLAETFSLTALVTNQVMGGGRGVSATVVDVSRIEDDGELTAALGTAWAHCVNVRVALEECNGARVLRVVKSPLSKEARVAYAIGDRGAQPSVQDVVHDLLAGLTEEELAML